MLLAVAATEIEMEPFLSLCDVVKERVITCVSGVGPVEAAVRVTKVLGLNHRRLRTVVNFGIGGAYIAEPTERGAAVLDLCLASRETLGDYGVCFNGRIETFANPDLASSPDFPLDDSLLVRAQQILAVHNLSCITGKFVTVNSCSGTAARGAFMRMRFNALCENMEGAAIARSCMEFSLPLLEIRAISNVVEDRPGVPWRVEEACDRAAQATALIVRGMQEMS